MNGRDLYTEMNANCSDSKNEAGERVEEVKFCIQFDGSGNVILFITEREEDRREAM